MELILKLAVCVVVNNASLQFMIAYSVQLLVGFLTVIYNVFVVNNTEEELYCIASPHHLK